MDFGLGFAIGADFWTYPNWSNGTINSTNINSTNRIPSRAIIRPASIANQQRLLNDWKNNATPQEKQAARNDGQRANSTFQKDASTQEKSQADRLNQEARNDIQTDRSNPNMDREAAQENALRDQARFDSNQDRSRSFGSYGGAARSSGFGGGHMGGFRR
jgi:hypothetical protein